MADIEKEQETTQLAASPNGYALRDTEATAAAAASLGRRKRRKLSRTRCLVCILLFVIFHAAIILVFTQTILKVRTPKFRLRSATIEVLNGGTPANPSYDGRMNAELSIDNPNFGRYKYRNATVSFYYRDTPIGEAFVRSSRTNWRSTKKLEIGVNLSFGYGQDDSQLSRDLISGIVPLTCNGSLRGRVEVLFLTKKSRSSQMNCSMEIVTATRQLRNIVCN